MHPIDVIIPCLNAEHTIRRCLQSVVEQDCAEVGIIVVDDGSTDATASIVEEIKNISSVQIRLIRTENRGAAAARNSGLCASSAPFVLFLDSDDWLLPASLSALSTVVRQGNADLAVGLAVDKLNGNLIPQPADRISKFSNPIAALIGAWWPISCVLLRRSQLKWNEELKVWEVIDYFLRHILDGYVVATCKSHVCVIDHSHREGRVTTIHNHYEPKIVLSIFRHFKQCIVAHGRGNHEVFSETDRIILGAAYGVVRRGGSVSLSNDINRKALLSYDWFKPFGLGGFCSIFGVDKGLELFARLNMALGR